METRESQIKNLWQELEPGIRTVEACGPFSWRIILDNGDYYIVTEGESASVQGFWIRFPKGDSHFWPKPSLASFLETSADENIHVAKASSTGKIQKILVQEGQQVVKDQVLLQIDSMKMQIEIKAPSATKVQKIAVREGDFVRFGQILIQFDPDN